MSIRRIWALFKARNYEFIRDKAGLSWNVLFPFVIVAGFGLIFSSNQGLEFKVGVFPATQDQVEMGALELPAGVVEAPSLDFIPFGQRADALERLGRHKLDMVVENRAGPLQYWVNSASPRGTVSEQLLRAAMVPGDQLDGLLTKVQVEGKPVRYLDWLFPGVLGMNIMFSAFFGVGWVIVRYRRNGVLKRLKVTPVTAFEYLSAQMGSRVMILLGSSFVVWIMSYLFFDIEIRGSFWATLTVFALGTACMVCFGLVLAARGTNEELTNGIINFICWPMMFLSEVWFSIEGAPAWVQKMAALFPLTPFLTAARKVMNDGASLSAVSHEMFLLVAMGLVFLGVGARLFSWTK